MFLHPRSTHRPFHFGPFPLEALPRDERVLQQEADRPQRAAVQDASQAGDGLTRALAHYRDLFARFAAGTPAKGKASVPDDLARRSIDLKGAGYFMDASGVSICRIPANAWLRDTARHDHAFAVVLLVEHPRRPERDNLAFAWTSSAVGKAAELRAAEIAACLAEYVRHMGFSARAHIAGDALLDVDRLAVLSGLAVRHGTAIQHPYLGDAFSLAAVSTDYALTADLPLEVGARNVKGLSYWWGINGARSGR